MAISSQNRGSTNSRIHFFRRSSRSASPTGPAKTAEPGIVGRLEPILKFGAAGFALVAAMGFPAVYLNFSRFGVPSHFPAYEHVLRAGILPACLLVLTGFYIFWVVREFRSGRTSVFLPIIPTLLFMPLIIGVLLVLVIGVAAYLLIITWVFVWVITTVTTGILGGGGFSNRSVLYIAMAVLIVGGILYFLGDTLQSWLNPIWNPLRSWLRRLPNVDLQRKNQSDNVERSPEGIKSPQGPQRQDSSREASKSTNERTEPKEAKSERERPGSADKEENVPWSVFAMIPILFVGLMYVIKALLYIWDPGYSPILSHRFILIFGLSCSAIYAAFMLLIFCGAWMESPDKSERLKGYVTISTLVTVLFLSSVGVYSFSLYRRIPRGLGGGRPEKVAMWVGKEDFPLDLQKKFSRASFFIDGDTIRCENIYLIYDDSATFIIADGIDPPISGAVFRRDKVKAISW